MSQDPGSLQGGRVSPSNPDGPECWAKHMSDGSVAAVLVNRGLHPADVTCTWEQIGFPASASASVRDLWQQKDAGTAKAQFVAKQVGSHDCAAVRLTEG